MYVGFGCIDRIAFKEMKTKEQTPSHIPEYEIVYMFVGILFYSVLTRDSNGSKHLLSIEVVWGYELMIVLFDAGTEFFENF